jgi:hypothetical protein
MATRAFCDWRVITLAYALLGVVLFALSNWLTTQPFGTGALMVGQTLFIQPPGILFLCLPILLLGFLFDSTRQKAGRLLLFSLGGLLGALCGMFIGSFGRWAGVQAFVQRSETVVRAIHEYEREHGQPPADLQQLVPQYLAAIPSTGMGAYPHYEYHCGDDAYWRFRKNPWALSVNTPLWGINFDMLIYLPNQNYPKDGYGGVLERVGSWAYVHE